MTTKIALITGGSRGLGRSMAMHLADRGVDSVVTYRSAKERAAEVVAEVESRGGRAVALPLDVTAIASFDSFTSGLKGALKEVWGRESFDYLVNNGGTGAHATFVETSEETFDYLMNVHLKGPFFLTQKLVPLIADEGRVVNISSGLTRFSFPGYAAYASMKGGVEVLSRYMAKELGARRITVNTLAPGAIETDFGGGAVRDNPDLNRMIASQTAMGRVGLPDDIGGAVASLLTGDNGWVTGQRIEVSGGQGL
ncbi:MAG: SDR family oxidoreductase [Myxococcales bacterium]|nr:SDR family oxidoreductase [Myxococcales bacterium]